MRVARTSGRRRRSGGVRSTHTPALERPQRLAGSEPRPADTIFEFSDQYCAGHERGAPFHVRSFFA